jgi:hypothetical protein
MTRRRSKFGMRWSARLNQSATRFVLDSNRYAGHRHGYEFRKIPPELVVE